MERQRVRSSNIRSAGYDPDAEIMEIEFENGSVYQYLSVPADVYDRFQQASSKGKFLNTPVKNRFRFRQVR